MSVLRTVRCPTCGSRHLLGQACRACAARPTGAVPRSRAFGGGAGALIPVLLVLLGTAAGLSGAAFAVAGSMGRGYGIAVVVGAWLALHLVRLGIEWDDGIDVRQLLLPAPLDWGVKLERLTHFWTEQGRWFRAVDLGGVLALFIVVIILLGR